ncbi:cytochrome d ubiquinol oxidase subunit II [Neptunicella marina]|uniref:Cytochrome d ubiquinol oxidase subunit II n=1 Tax=Neptunicella marina TaxID=2125989 RepID=A0A8J6IVC8_9ALTE|nr:cytochrome d ubiquinol oxidase subunit II [Neptunicella marina]MBC3767386.1 cytochrome d ubiquinol oxidase subunit II [Neptunicella marina]
MLEQYLPDIFLILMGLAVLIYAILDGYDLGVGIMLPMNNKTQRDQMIASIGPFWDANETWLVLAIGILLIAFPQAYSLVLHELYIPVSIMLSALILRGVAFDFRAKAVTHHQLLWDRLFKLGSLIAALTQGYALGMYVMGFKSDWQAYTFALLSAAGVAAAYAYIGGAWLVLKTEGSVQKYAAKWARRAGWLAAIGIAGICIINPLISPAVAERWLSMPAALLLLPVPVMCVLIVAVVDRYLRLVPHQNDFGCWIPFGAVTSLFVLCILGLAYSYFPYVVPNQLTAEQAASAPEALRFIFYGVIFVLPVIVAYTLFSYWIFRGKSTELRYW